MQESDAGHPWHGIAVELRVQGHGAHATLRLSGMAEAPLGQSLRGWAQVQFFKINSIRSYLLKITIYLRVSLEMEYDSLDIFESTIMMIIRREVSSISCDKIIRLRLNILLEKNSEAFGTIRCASIIVRWLISGTINISAMTEPIPSLRALLLFFYHPLLSPIKHVIRPFIGKRDE